MRRYETMEKHPFEPWPKGTIVRDSLDAIAVDAAQDNQRAYGETWIAVRVEGRNVDISYPTKMLRVIGDAVAASVILQPPAPPPAAARQQLRERASTLVAPTRDEIHALNAEARASEEQQTKPHLMEALNIVIREVSIIQGITVGAGLRAMIDSMLKARE